nr:hypothetical protein [Tanacetum cinerariifolium]
FWNTVAIKQVKDVTRLQALVNKKKVVVTEAIIIEVLWLDDAEGVDCLPNVDIFIELARIGYEKPSTKLTFYKAFFSNQCKFLIYTILLSLSAKRTSWNEFSSAMASAIIYLSTGDLSTHTTKYASPTLTQKVFTNIRSVRKGFSRVETPLFEGMLVGQEIGEEGDAGEHVEDVTTALDACAALTRRVKHLEYDKVAQALEITKLKKRVKKLEKGNKGRMIDEMDKDDVVVLMDKKEEDKKVEEAKKQQIKMDKEYARKLHAEINKDIDWDVAIDHVKLKAKEDPTNVAGFKLDYFKGMSYDDIHPIFKAKFSSNTKFLLKTKEQIEEEENRALQSINETPAQKEAKRRKLNEEVKDLKRHLEIVPNEDDVYTKATPLARKVPVVDYEIIELNNKPY